MSMSEIVDALELGLITEQEATEQGMVDSVDALYGRLHARRSPGARRGRDERPSSARH